MTATNRICEVFLKNRCVDRLIVSSEWTLNNVILIVVNICVGVIDTRWVKFQIPQPWETRVWKSSESFGLAVDCQMWIKRKLD